MAMVGEEEQAEGLALAVLVGRAAVEEEGVDPTQGGGSLPPLLLLQARMCLPTVETSATNLLVLWSRQLQPAHRCGAPLVRVYSSSVEPLFQLRRSHQT